jgi:hypothetical protein
MSKCKCHCSCKEPTHVVVELQGREVKIELPGPGVGESVIVQDFSLHSPVHMDSVVFHTIRIPILRVE